MTKISKKTKGSINWAPYNQADFNGDMTKAAKGTLPAKVNKNILASGKKHVKKGKK